MTYSDAFFPAAYYRCFTKKDKRKFLTTKTLFIALKHDDFENSFLDSTSGHHANILKKWIILLRFT